MRATRLELIAEAEAAHMLGERRSVAGSRLHRGAEFLNRFSRRGRVPRGALRAAIS